MPVKPTAAVFAVTSGDKPDVLVTMAVANSLLTAKYSSLTPVVVNGQTYLFGYSPVQTSFHVYEFTPAAPWLKLMGAKPVVGKAIDIINAFTLGNLPYLCAYAAKNGVFQVYAIANDLSFSQPYKFYRNHELAISKSFTTLK